MLPSSSSYLERAYNSLEVWLPPSERLVVIVPAAVFGTAAVMADEEASKACVAILYFSNIASLGGTSSWSSSSSEDEESSCAEEVRNDLCASKSGFLDLRPRLLFPLFESSSLFD